MDHCRRSLVLFISAFWLWPAIGSAEESVITMKPVRVALPAESLRDLDIKLPLTSDLLYKAELLPADPPSEGLLLGFFDPETKADPRAIEASDFVRQGDFLHLRVRAERCCPSGTYERTVELIPQQATAWPIHLPVHVTVQGSSWTCHRPVLVFLLVLTGGALLNLYLYGMVIHSHFLPERHLALRLKPLLRDGTGREVEAVIIRDLPIWRRALSWLLANPLVFGLPGGAYHETAELTLWPRNNVSLSKLSLMSHRKYHKVLQAKPHLGHGKLFATALPRLKFFAVPHRGRVGAFTMKSAPQENAPAEMVWLEPDQDLLRPMMDDEDVSVAQAGRRIGGRA